MDVQIPLYRAKKLDSDEYVEGDLIKKFSWYFIAIQDIIGSNKAYELLTFQDGEYGNIFEVDPSTLAIHFPDMLDSEGNKIFASLSEDGKGGDKIKADKTITPVIYKDCRIKSRYLDCSLNSELLKGFDIVGIQK